MSNTTERSEDAEDEVSDGHLLDLLRRAAAPCSQADAGATSATPSAHAVDASADDPLVGAVLGDYRVLSRLGAGGMGVVYKARDEKLQRFVALKTVPSLASGDGAAHGRLLAEARSAAAVTHPAIAAIHGIETIQGRAFLVMEHIDGVTLRAHLRAATPTPPEALRIARAIAEGLARAHVAGIVHRDLKPENVMVDRDGRIKILDFGLARAGLRGAGAPAGTPPEAAGAMAGTPAYMSPEQRQGDAVDARSDVYSFGLVFHELLVGALPRFEEEPRDLAFRSLVERLGPAGPGVGWILRSCLAEAPARRFAHGGEIAEALAGLEDVPPRREPSKRRAHLAVLVVAAVIAGAVLLGRARAPQPPGASPQTPPHLTLRRATANARDRPLLQAEISPDGAQLAYVDGDGLFVRALEGPTVRKIPWSDGPVTGVAWGASGADLVVGAKVGGSALTGLFLVPLAGGAPRELARGTFAWFRPSPDGQRIAYADREEVGFLALPDSGRHVLGPKGPGCTVGELTWSPDGQRLAFLRRCFTSLRTGTVETLGLQGGKPVVLVSDPRLFQASSEGGVVWLRDGRIVYALADWFPAEKGANLWSIAVDATGAAAGPPERLTEWNDVVAGVFSHGAAARRLAFLRFRVQSDIHVAALADGGRRLEALRRFTPSDRNERLGAFTRDGQALTYFSDFNGNFDIFTEPLVGAAPRALTADGASETFPQVTPAGDAILFFRLPFREDLAPVVPTLLRLEQDGTEPRALWSPRARSYPSGAGRPQPWEARVRCPRRSDAPCVVGETIEGTLHLSRLDPLTGATALLRTIPDATAALQVWALSPDGTRLAVPTQQGTLRIVPLEGGATREVAVGGSCQPAHPAWSHDGAALFTSAECSEGPTFQLLRLGLDGSRTVLWADPVNWCLEIDAAPDGRHLAVVIKEMGADAWIAEGL